MKILIVDDQEIARKGIRYGLADFNMIEHIDEVSNGAEAIDYVREHTPDVILMDIMMPGVDGAEATRQIKAINSQIKIIMMTATYSEELILSALAAKTDALCLKSIEFDVLHHVLDVVIAGGLWLDDEAAACVVRNLSLLKKQPKPASLLKRDEPQRRRLRSPGSDYTHKPLRTVELTPLTQRENEVLSLVTQGLSNKQIASELGVTIHTIKIHMSSIIQKLGVGDRTQAAIKALEEGLVKASV